MNDNDLAKQQFLDFIKRPGTQAWIGAETDDGEMVTWEFESIEKLVQNHDLIEASNPVKMRALGANAVDVQYDSMNPVQFNVTNGVQVLDVRIESSEVSDEELLHMIHSKYSDNTM